MRRKEYLGQPTIRLRRNGWEMSTERSLRRKTGEKEKKKKNKVEEFQLANLARPSQAKSIGLNVYRGHLSLLFHGQLRD